MQIIQQSFRSTILLCAVVLQLGFALKGSALAATFSVSPSIVSNTYTMRPTLFDFIVRCSALSH